MYAIKDENIVLIKAKNYIVYIRSLITRVYYGQIYSSGYPVIGVPITQKR